jgi:serine/threonine protein kinase
MKGLVTFEQLDIASGTYGSVSFGCLVSDPSVKVAVKKFANGEQNEWTVFTKREIGILTRLQGHPNIVKLIANINEDGFDWMITERCQMSLEQLLHMSQHGGMFAVEEHKSYFQQMMQGIAHCHKNNIVHRDLKPDNLLIDKGFLKIVDFGMSKEMLSDDPSLHSTRVTGRYYRAPEVCLGLGNYNRMIDIWSAGCILGELMYGKVLFPSESDQDQLFSIWDLCGIPKVERYSPKAMHPKIQSRVNDFMRTRNKPSYDRLLLKTLTEERKKDPSYRRGFLTDQAFKLLDWMLQLFHSDRPSATQVLDHPYLKTEKPAPHPPERNRIYQSKKIKR